MGAPDTTSGTDLELLSRAEQMLATVAHADEALKLADMAEAARVYARKADLGTAAVNHATIIKARALKRMAELVDVGQARGEIATRDRGGANIPNGVTSQDTVPRIVTPVESLRVFVTEPTGPGHVPCARPATLSDLGISRQRLHEARKLEPLPDVEITEIGSRATDEGREVTLSEIKRTAHVANNTGNNEWYTPAKYIEAARQVMGGIDLDPASHEEANVVVGACRFYTEAEDGLAHDWAGRLWMNPPYSQPLIEQFCTKLAESHEAGAVTEACVLVNNATETRWFQTLASVAAAICFPAGRVKFWAPGREAAPLQGQAILYLGNRPETFMSAFADFGFGAEL